MIHLRCQSRDQNTTVHNVYDNGVNDTEIRLHLDHDLNDDSFDTFVLQNFVPFSGRQNVNQWLDETENRFNQFHIGRNLRYVAISLLVKGEAKRKYLKFRKEIRFFDAFYEYLLSKFETLDNASFQSKSCQTMVDNSSELLTSYEVKLENESEQFVSNNNKTLNSTCHSSITNPTAMDILGVANTIGEKPIVKSAANLDTTSNSICDQTLNDPCKAIVGNSIKNSKIFKGGKDDVNKWIEEIEYLLDLAHIPESVRLDLISYLLRGDALEWFKNNRSSLTSWNIFVLNVKKAFISSFHEELAFKKLESYSHGRNQSIQSFFNEVLKLCKEADCTMSEVTKLKNLLNKAKPSIHFEVREKKPKSIAEFLEHAKEAEELIQLSNMTVDDSNNYNNITVVQQPSIISLTSTSSASVSPAFNNTPTNYSSKYSRGFDYKNRFVHNRNSHFNRKTSPFSSFRAPQTKAPCNSNNSSRRYRVPYSNNSANQNRNTLHMSQTNSSGNVRPRQYTANTISSVDPSTEVEPFSELLSFVTCSRCSRVGHEASACPNF